MLAGRTRADHSAARDAGSQGRSGDGMLGERNLVYAVSAAGLAATEASQTQLCVEAERKFLAGGGGADEQAGIAAPHGATPA